MEVGWWREVELKAIDNLPPLKLVLGEERVREDERSG